MDLQETLRNGSVRIPEAGCWLWEGSLHSTGYGTLYWDGTTQFTHRLSYRTFRGEIPDKLYVLHRCDVRCCINPNHLFVGTHQDNMDDMVSKGRAGRDFVERCKHGHDNWVTIESGRRVCNTCRKNNYLARKATPEGRKYFREYERARRKLIKEQKNGGA